MFNAPFIKLQSIFLVGFRASGKSTIGIVLAKALTNFFVYPFEKQVEIYNSSDILRYCQDKLLENNDASLSSKNETALICNKNNDFTYKKWAWIDTDNSIIEHLGQDIDCIVAKNGWDYFRLHESSILQNCKESYTVFSTGGGVVLNSENCNFMKKQGYVAYLKASPETLIKRLHANPQKSQRPALTDESFELEVENILKFRAPLYEGVADIIVDAELAINDIVNNILKQYMGNYLACFKK